MEDPEASSSDFLRPLQVSDRANKPKKDRWADFSPLKCIENSPDRAPKRPILITITSPNKRSPFKSFRPSQLTFTSPVMKKVKTYTPNKKTPDQRTPGKESFTRRPPSNSTPPKSLTKTPIPCRSLFDGKVVGRTQIDWSLKTHTKFTCHKPFPYRGCFGFREESTGITAFARCSNQANNSTKSELASSSVLFSPVHKSHDCSSTSSLRQHTIVWQFPNLPWLNLYPRLGRLANTKTSTTPNLSSLPTPAVESLQNEFKVSLKSSYHLLRTRQSAYFYCCSPNFTALFRSAGVAAAIDEVHVLIFPTSSGFRKALRKENISFSTPYAPKESNDCTSSSIFNDDTNTSFECKEDGSNKRNSAGGEDDEIAVEGGDDEDEDADAILGALGLSQHDFPTLHSAKLKNRKTAASALNDNSSLVLVVGSDVQLLVNMLCDQVTKFCVSPIGPLANIPPTLLSPVAFTGGTLRPLRIKMSSSHLPDGSTVHKLDIHGPMLPTSFYSLCEFLRHSQDGSLVGNFAVHEQTEIFTTFNSLKFNPINAIFLQESLVSTGLTDQLITDLCNKDSQAKNPIREIRFEHDSMSIN